MLTSSLCCLLLAAAAADADPQNRSWLNTQWTIRGSVAKLAADGSVGEPEKSFELVLVVTDEGDGQLAIDWLVDETGQGAWPWHSRFGRWLLDAQHLPAGGLAPALLYERSEGSSTIEIAPPLAKLPENLNPESAWEEGKLRYQVLEAATTAGEPGWRIQVSNAYGRKRVVWVGKSGNQLLAAKERVFMGQGEEYELDWRVADRQQLSAAATEEFARSVDRLIQLRDRLKLAARSEHTELNEDALALLGRELPALRQAIDRGPLAAVVAAAEREHALQQERAGDVATLVDQHLGRAVEKFSLAGLAGAELNEADLQGQVTVLHFWDYRDTPLKEPYGQIGYLDFLYEHRKADGVRVFGVAVDRRHADSTQQAAARRSVDKLRDFMNLSYPLLLDAGTLLKQLGDPRLKGASLPLFVVIDRGGRIRHYHVGLYEVDREAGLKELDAAITQVLAQDAAPAGAAR